MTIPNPIGKYSFEQKGFPLDNSLWEAGAYRYFFDNGEYSLCEAILAESPGVRAAYARYLRN